MDLHSTFLILLTNNPTHWNFPKYWVLIEVLNFKVIDLYFKQCMNHARSSRPSSISNTKSKRFSFVDCNFYVKSNGHTKMLMLQYSQYQLGIQSRIYENFKNSEKFKLTKFSKFKLTKFSKFWWFYLVYYRY